LFSFKLLWCFSLARGRGSLGRIGIIIKDDFTFGFIRIRIGIIQTCFNFLCFSWASRGRQDRAGTTSTF
jgi:hypothetical protein